MSFENIVSRFGVFTFGWGGCLCLEGSKKRRIFLVLVFGVVLMGEGLRGEDGVVEFY